MASSIVCASSSNLSQETRALLPPRDMPANLRPRKPGNPLPVGPVSTACLSINHRYLTTLDPPLPTEDFENENTLMGEEDTPDNATLESASYIGEDDRFDMSHLSGHRKRKREEQKQDFTSQEHAMYGDELLDYFLLSRNEQPAVKPDPPANFQPNWPIDQEGHTALHWAAAMGDVDVIKQLKRFNANSAARNVRGETPFMKSCHFTNSFDKQTYPAVLKELFETVDARDNAGCTVIHHAATMKSGRIFSPSCSRYYLDNILNKLQESLDPSAFQQLMDSQDNEGNTALHLAAQRNARKSIRALLGRDASTDVTNNEGVRAEDLIMELNATKKDRGPQRSSSPFAPDSQRHASFRDAFPDKMNRKLQAPFQSAAATTVQSRISPLIMEKFQDLAKSYDDEWHEKEIAEGEARRILANTQAELNAFEQQIAELESHLEPEDSASRTMNDANLAKHQVLSLITHQNRLHVHQAVEGDLSRVNGDSAEEGPYGERLKLAQDLSKLLSDQRKVENDYVDALSMVGVGDKIDKYRKLLKQCLDPKDGESLDTNLDSLIEMMEEERDVPDIDGSTAGDPMEI